MTFPLCFLPACFVLSDPRASAPSAMARVRVRSAPVPVEVYPPEMEGGSEVQYLDRRSTTTKSLGHECPAFFGFSVRWGNGPGKYAPRDVHGRWICCYEGGARPKDNHWPPRPFMCHGRPWAMER